MRLLDMNSLRVRLLVMLLAVTGLIWLGAAWWSFYDARHEAEELLDAQLAQSAHLLLAQTRHELVEEGENHLAAYEALDDHELHPYEQKLQFRILDARGNTLLASANPPPAMAAGSTGYAEVWVGDEGWRMLATSDGILRVEVAQSLSIRDELARHVALRLALPVLLALPLLGGLIFLVVGRALRPLDSLAGKVASRTAANLAPLETDTLPREVLPLASALNSLLKRLDHALDSERRFTADAAHELRTPLAAIEIQAQVALASHKEDGRAHALEQVLAGTRRAARLVEQLLRLARLDPLAGPPRSRNLELAQLAREVVADPHLDSARIHLECVETAVIAGDPELLSVALRNLLDNALRYSPAASRVTLGVSLDNDVPSLWVEDSGPGVTAAELPRLTERFYRGGEVVREGSGLGLAIVARIARLHGARLIFENREAGGLRATLAWSS
ncbi:MAG: sensor histidine kinase N-terminal domain-containing protein [Pseudomonadota bacterium]|nr:sensor histidine kinase N-terminal domain-containing protein [Pseudomonadota bacterium]